MTSTVLRNEEKELAFCDPRLCASKRGLKPACGCDFLTPVGGGAMDCSNLVSGDAMFALSVLSDEQGWRALCLLLLLLENYVAVCLVGVANCANFARWVVKYGSFATGWR